MYDPTQRRFPPQHTLRVLLDDVTNRIIRVEYNGVALPVDTEADISFTQDFQSATATLTLAVDELLFTNDNIVESAPAAKLALIEGEQHEKGGA